MLVWFDRWCILVFHIECFIVNKNWNMFEIYGLNMSAKSEILMCILPMQNIFISNLIWDHLCNECKSNLFDRNKSFFKLTELKAQVSISEDNLSIVCRRKYDFLTGVVWAFEYTEYERQTKIFTWPKLFWNQTLCRRCIQLTLSII